MPTAVRVRFAFVVLLAVHIQPQVFAFSKQVKDIVELACNGCRVSTKRHSSVKLQVGQSLNVDSKAQSTF